MDYPNDRLEMLRAMVASCQARGVALTLVIPPAHALQLAMLDSMGLWSSFERWKADMARVASSADGVALWDFAYCHAPTVETVPQAPDPTARMEWWIDSSHFRPRLGNVVIQRVMGRAADASVTFGVRLTAANAQARLTAMRQGMRDYLATHPNEAAWVGAIR